MPSSGIEKNEMSARVNLVFKVKSDPLLCLSVKRKSAFPMVAELLVSKIVK